MKIFIAGPREIKELNENIFAKLENICKKEYEVFVGDAEGIDSCVQKYLNEKMYKKVKVFASNGRVRNNYGDWKIEKVNVATNITGFDFYAQKDLQMARKSDLGFMIWNGKSRGTFNNIVNLLKMQKEVVLYYTINKQFYDFKDLHDLENFLDCNVKLNVRLRKIFPQKESEQFSQMVLF